MANKHMRQGVLERVFDVKLPTTSRVGLTLTPLKGKALVLQTVAEMPEFAGTVKFVVTHDLERPEIESPAGEGYHEFKNAETYFLIGDAFGKAMVNLLKNKE